MEQCDYVTDLKSGHPNNMSPLLSSLCSFAQSYPDWRGFKWTSISLLSVSTPQNQDTSLIRALSFVNSKMTTTPFLSLGSEVLE